VDFCQFVSVLEVDAVAITNRNIGGLSLLSDEFGFGALGLKLSEFRRLTAFKEKPTNGIHRSAAEAVGAGGAGGGTGPGAWVAAE
jgi:hypothetical protein